MHRIEAIFQLPRARGLPITLRPAFRQAFPLRNKPLRRYAGVSILDKYVLDRRLPSVVGFYAWVTIHHTVYVSILLAVTGIPWDGPGDKLLFAFLSGLSLGAGFVCMFLGLKLEEASRAVALTQVYPVYVALLAVAFLEESLKPVQWVAILLIVFGAMQVSLRGGLGSMLPRLSRGFPFLLVTGIGQGVGLFLVNHDLFVKTPRPPGAIGG